MPELGFQFELATAQGEWPRCLRGSKVRTGLYRLRSWWGAWPRRLVDGQPRKKMQLHRTDITRHRLCDLWRPARVARTFYLHTR